MVPSQSNLKAVIISSILLLLSGCSAPKDKVTEVDSEPKFSTLQKEYFESLDLRVSEDRLRKIPGYAAELGALADSERAKLEAGRLISEPDRERAGLIFIYDALLTHNNTIAAVEGKLILKDLAAYRKFSPATGDDKQELSARANYVVAEFTSAAALRPQDRRIDSWFAAAKANVERIQTGTVSQKALESALDAIPVRPTFNLWTALLMFHDKSVSSPLSERLAAEAKRFVDAISEGSDPCAEFHRSDPCDFTITDPPWEADRRDACFYFTRGQMWSTPFAFS